jgi:hypothetical protein
MAELIIMRQVDGQMLAPGELLKSVFLQPILQEEQPQQRRITALWK